MKVTIKLIKSNISADHIIKDDRKIHSEVIDGVGTFYYKISRTAKPEWVDDFFQGRLRCADRFKVASAAGVLLVIRKYNGSDRIFAITFGSGRYILQDNVSEERFGLKIALNSIQYDSLRSIDFNKMDGIPSIVRNQVSRLTGIENFNINTQVNLLKSITGKLPDDKQMEIGTTMTGADSLTISTDMTVDNTIGKLDQLFSLYQSEAYKQHFSWVDNISAIGDNTLRGELDQALFDKINTREIDGIWLALPSIVDWAGISYLKYSGRNANKHDDVDIDNALAELFEGREDVKAIDFKTIQVKAFDNNDNRIKEWSLYKCLYGELIKDVHQYILNDGCWYLVDQNFYTQIENFYQSVCSSDVNFIPWLPRVEDGKEKYELEKEYNERLADSDERFCNMDRDLVYLQGNQDKIEFCDVYGTGGQIIHVKRKGGSELIGHLLNQGLVSATLLLTDEFRSKFNAKLHESNRDGWTVPQHRVDFNAGNYSIIYGIMCDTEGDELKLPFFSKIILKEAVGTLKSYGFQVFMNKISKGVVENAGE